MGVENRARNMGEIDIETAGIEFFNLIDVDGSGEIDENEIVATIMALAAACEEGLPEEAQAGVGGVLIGIGQLGAKLEAEGKEKCSRADWDAFEPEKPEDMDEETWGGMMMCFLGLVMGCLENKAEIQSALRELLAQEDFADAKAKFMEEMGK